MQLVYFAQVERSCVVAERRGTCSAALDLGGPYLAGPIKIGITGAIRDRMLALSSTTKQHVRVIGAFGGTDADERATHRLFEHLRIGHFGKAGTEWFRPAWELTNFITSLPHWDFGSPYGDWPGRRSMPSARSRGSDLFHRAAEGPTSNGREHERCRSDAARTLSTRTGLWVSSAGVWALSSGSVRPCGVLRSAIAALFGIPIESWQGPAKFRVVFSSALRSPLAPTGTT